MTYLHQWHVSTCMPSGQREISGELFVSLAWNNPNLTYIRPPRGPSNGCLFPRVRSASCPFSLRNMHRHVGTTRRQLSGSLNAAVPHQAEANPEAWMIHVVIQSRHCSCSILNLLQPPGDQTFHSSSLSGILSPLYIMWTEVLLCFITPLKRQ